MKNSPNISLSVFGTVAFHEPANGFVVTIAVSRKDFLEGRASAGSWVDGRGESGWM